MTAPLPRGGPTVGFDLDMTLIDSRSGIAAVLRALSAETGVFIDADLAVSRLGPPLNDELAHWFPADHVETMADRFRAIYPSEAIIPTALLPGAGAAVAAVRAAGGAVVVITSKFPANAQLHLDHCELVADALVGWAFGDGKRDALRRYHADVYVGDHRADMASARAAGALAVGVLTGPCTEPELIDAGADVVLPDLLAFPGWLTRWLPGWRPGPSSR